MDINRKNAIKIWDRQFGKDVSATDFAGRSIQKGAFGQLTSTYGWCLTHIVPRSVGGSSEEDNLICAHVKTAAEKEENFPSFNANDVRYKISKESGSWTIEKSSDADAIAELAEKEAKAKELWSLTFGDASETTDFAGRTIYRDSYGSGREGAWKVAPYVDSKPTENKNAYIAHLFTIAEARGKTAFKSNGRFFTLIKENGVYSFIDSETKTTAPSAETEEDESAFEFIGVEIENSKEETVYDVEDKDNFAEEIDTVVESEDDATDETDTAVEIEDEVTNETVSEINQSDKDNSDFMQITFDTEEIIDDSSENRAGFSEDLQDEKESDDVLQISFDDGIDEETEDSVTEETDSEFEVEDEVAEENDTVVEDEDEVTEEIDTVVEDEDEVTEEIDTVVEDEDEVTEEIDTVVEDEDEVAEEIDTVVEDEDEVTEEIDTVVEAEDEVTEENDTVVEAEDEVTEENDTVVEDKNEVTEKNDTVVEAEDEVAEEAPTEKRDLSCPAYVSEYIENTIFEHKNNIPAEIWLDFIVIHTFMPAGTSSANASALTDALSSIITEAAGRFITHEVSELVGDDGSRNTVITFRFLSPGTADMERIFNTCMLLNTYAPLLLKKFGLESFKIYNYASAFETAFMSYPTTELAEKSQGFKDFMTAVFRSDKFYDGEAPITLYVSESVMFNLPSVSKLHNADETSFHTDARLIEHNFVFGDIKVKLDELNS